MIKFFRSWNFDFSSCPKDNKLYKNNWIVIHLLSEDGSEFAMQIFMWASASANDSAKFCRLSSRFSFFLSKKIVASMNIFSFRFISCFAFLSFFSDSSSKVIIFVRSWNSVRTAVQQGVSKNSRNDKLELHLLSGHLNFAVATLEKNRLRFISFEQIRAPNFAIAKIFKKLRKKAKKISLACKNLVKRPHTFTSGPSAFEWGSLEGILFLIWLYFFRTDSLCAKAKTKNILRSKAK